VSGRETPLGPLLPALLAAGLMLLAGVVALLLGQATLFPSLGPTAFVQVETPDNPAARPWNVVVGHAIGAAAGYIAVLLAGAAAAPSVLATSQVTTPRVLAAIIAVLLTLLVGSLAKASHPPAAATTLLVALGGFAEVPKGPIAIAIGVVIVAVAGELARRAVLAPDAPPDARSLGLPWASSATHAEGRERVPTGGR
jgi:HPP family